MNAFSLAHLADGTLLAALSVLAARDRATTAELVAHIAEVDARRLWAPAGFPSMFRYCVDRLRMCEDIAYKRIRVARAARQCGAVIPALGDGRLTLSGALLLVPHLKDGAADELVRAASHRTNAEIELLLAGRFPKPDVETRIEALPVPPTSGARMDSQLAVRPVEESPEMPTPPNPEASELAVRPVAPGAERGRVAPLSPGRFALRATIGQEMYDDIRRAQALLGGSVTGGDVVEVLRRAMRLLVRGLEKRKLGATPRPRARRSDGAGRYLPAEVRREVAARDRNQCTFVSADGHRCEERSALELDHGTPVAHGGRSTTANLRPRCRAHNQLEAERAFGAEFMRRKREAERAQRNEQRAAAERIRAEAAAKAKAAAEEVRAAAEARDATERAQSEVLPWLRQLGFRLDEARRAIERSGTNPEAPLDQRVREALRHLAPTGARRGMPAAACGG